MREDMIAVSHRDLSDPNSFRRGSEFSDLHFFMNSFGWIWLPKNDDWLEFDMACGNGCLDKIGTEVGV